MPLRGGKDAVLVNWIGVTVTNAKGKITSANAHVASLPASRDTVADLVACARVLTMGS